MGTGAGVQVQSLLLQLQPGAGAGSGAVGATDKSKAQKMANKKNIDLLCVYVTCNSFYVSLIVLV